MKHRFRITSAGIRRRLFSFFGEGAPMQRLTQPSAGRIIGEKRLSLHFKTLGVKKYFSLYGFAYLLWLALLLV
ncbi:MAG: hypothetical protein IJT39_00085 [Bacteroidales bacterium]|nr:hypothetical protein [Bacteroidales bacterium]